MKERFPSLIALFLLLSLVVGTWWAADYTQRAVQNDPPRRYTHEMDSWSRNFTMVRTDVDGKPINRLEGDYGEHYPDDDSYVVTMPRAVGLRPGTPVTIGTSQTGTMYEGGKRIVMEKDAHLHRKPDEKTPAMDVHSQKLIILPDDDVMYTDLPALVTRGQSTMHGVGMKYNNKTSQLEVFSASNVEINNSDTRSGSSSSNSGKKSGDSSAASGTGAKPDSAQGTVNATTRAPAATEPTGNKKP